MLSVRGVYDGKQIKSLEHFNARPNREVIITFTNRRVDQSEMDGKAMGLLDLCGVWEDDRRAEEIVDDIYKSRTTNERDINL